MIRCLSLLFCFIGFLVCSSTSFAISENNQSTIQKAIDLQLHKKPIWKSLLHFSRNTFRITDSGFLLTHQKPSLKNELIATLKALHQKDNRILCRFPARYLWLKHHLALPEKNLEVCKEIQTFKEKAPMDTLSLVYASENLTSPSSMMGHVLLRLQGVDENNNRRDHAISFFTMTDVDPARLVFQTLFVGKQGFYTLSPTSEKLRIYLEEEQRSVWEYQLKLTEFEKELITYHLFELKPVSLKYFFHTYNCATLVNFILSLASPEIREPEGLWLTPIDVVKAINKTNKIQLTKVIPSDRWIIRLLGEHLTTEEKQKIKNAIDSRDVSSIPQSQQLDKSVFYRDLSTAYVNYLHDNNSITAKEFEKLSVDLENTFGNLQQNINIEVSDYKSPVKTPRDSQIVLGYTSLASTDYIKTTFLPAAHALSDDNSQYFTENDLRMAELSLLTEVDTGKTHLDEFKLYHIQAITPRDYFTGGISGKFSIGAKKHHEILEEKPTEFYVEGAIGFAYRWQKDIDFYAMIGGGIAYHDDIYGYANPELGMIIRQVFDMKTLIKYRPSFNYANLYDSVNSFEITHAKYFNEKFSIELSYSQWDINHQTERFDVNFKYFF